MLVACSLQPAALVFSQSITSTELINNAKDYDGRRVIYEGEVIGEIMKRGDFSWINVNDGKNAIGIWLKTSETGKIRYAGSYKAKGDKVNVTGVFNRACAHHGGDLDIHAENLFVLEAGQAINEDISKEKLGFAKKLILILCITIILSIFSKVLRKKYKKQRT